jgi:pantetheine-phosphate adenylyltransferase
MSGLATGVYPGTFDPVTNGHMDVIARAGKLVERLIVAVAANDGKAPMFSLDDRVAMLKGEIKRLAPEVAKKIEVRSFDNLLVDFAEQCGAQAIVRGLRAVSDFEFEFQMASMNARLNQRVETVFLMASDKHQFISSRFVKEIARLGGDIGHFVSPAVKEMVIRRLSDKNAAAE